MENGKLTTRVSTKTGIHTIQANSFEELQKAAEAKVKKENNRQYNTGGATYAALGRATQNNEKLSS